MDMSPPPSGSGTRIRNPHAGHGRGFRSFKTSEPIVYTQRASRDALIQATLDRHVTRISPTPKSQFVPVPDAYFTFRATFGGKDCLVALCERSHGVTFVPSAGPQFGLALGNSHILSDPLVTTARTIWSHRHELVPPIFELRLTRQLADKPDGAALIDLEAMFRDEPETWLGYLLALACRGTVHLGGIERLTDQTRVFCGPSLGG